MPYGDGKYKTLIDMIMKTSKFVISALAVMTSVLVAVPAANAQEMAIAMRMARLYVVHMKPIVSVTTGSSVLAPV